MRPLNLASSRAGDCEGPGFDESLCLFLLIRVAVERERPASVPSELITRHGAGITRVRFAEYVVASWVGMLPGTFAYVYLGGAGRSTVDAVGGADRNGLPVAKIMLYVVRASARIHPKA